MTLHPFGVSGHSRWPSPSRLRLAEWAMPDRFVGPGAQVWDRHVYKVDNVPDLPREVVNFLNQACPISRDGRPARETHFLTLVPAVVGGRPYSIEAMHYHLSNFGGDVFMTDHGQLWVEERDGCRSLAKTSWVLQYGGILPGTGGLPVSQAIEVLKRYPLYQQALLMEHIGTMALQFACNGQRAFRDCTGICKEIEGDLALSASGPTENGSGILPGAVHVGNLNLPQSTGLAVVVDLGKLV